MSISLEDFLQCLHKEYSCRYSRIFHKDKFDSLVNSIIQGNSEMKKMDIVDFTFQFGQEGPGYVTKDDILSFPPPLRSESTSGPKHPRTATIYN